MKKERNKAELKGWEVAKAVTRNRECWSGSMTTLRAYWHDDDDDDDGDDDGDDDDDDDKKIMFL